VHRIARAAQSDTDSNQLLSVPQVCEEWVAHENTVYGWIRSGQLPAVKIGPRMIRVRRSDLEEFLTPYEAEASVWARPVK
jgi:excisionase family DNA binding protein